MPRTRPPDPAAFRAEAIELARTSGKTIPELAKDLGVPGQTLRNWAHQADVDAGMASPGSSPPPSSRSCVGCAARTRCCARSRRY